LKTAIISTLVCFTIFTVSCSKQVEQLSTATSTESAITTSHFIGEHFGGSIIFYLNNTGEHGIIATEQDLEEPAVWAYTDTITNAIASKPRSGAKNTERIFHVQGDPGDEAEDYAAIECREFSIKGYNDWFMPSKDELNEMYKQKEIIGGFRPYAYWSSTEVNISKAWFQNFGNGAQIKASKIYSYALRPIRYF
jgi:hypothetical protein